MLFTKCHFKYYPWRITSSQFESIGMSLNYGTLAYPGRRGLVTTNCQFKESYFPIEINKEVAVLAGGFLHWHAFKWNLQKALSTRFTDQAFIIWLCQKCVERKYPLKMYRYSLIVSNNGWQLGYIHTIFIFFNANSKSAQKFFCCFSIRICTIVYMLWIFPDL